MADFQKRSMVWKFYVDMKDRKAQCRMCNKVLSYNGPFNLTRHLRTVHQSIFDNVTNGESKDTITLTTKSNLPTTSTSGSKTKTTLPTKKINDLNKYLVELYTKQYMDLSIVESREFKQFVNKLNRNYQIPDLSTLSNDLLTDYCKDSKDSIKTLLEQASYVSLTTDTWTSSFANERYLTVTAHFLDEQSEKKACMLECLQLEETQNLSMALANICYEWGITDKIVAVTSNNDSDMITAIKLNSWIQITCLAYTIDGTVQKALREIEDTLIKVSNIFEFIQISPPDPEAAEVKFEESPQLKLKLGDETHWTSTVDMFEKIASTSQSLTLKISKDDLDIILKSLELLSYFKAFSEEMNSKPNVPISEVILIWNGLIQQCEQFILNDQLPISVGNMAECILNELRENFDDVENNEVFAQSTLLDPRFKKYGFKNDLALQKVLSRLKHLVSDTNCESQLKEEHKEEGECQDEVPVHSKKPRTIWDDFDEKVNDIIISSDPLSTGVIELNEYLEETLLPRTQCPFKWWNDRKGIYPTIYEIFTKRMCIAATSVPSERIFSKSGQDITRRRNMLSGQFVPQTVLLNFNM